MLSIIVSVELLILERLLLLELLKSIFLVEYDLDVVMGFSCEVVVDSLLLFEELSLNEKYATHYPDIIGLSLKPHI